MVDHYACYQATLVPCSSATTAEQLAEMIRQNNHRGELRDRATVQGVPIAQGPNTRTRRARRRASAGVRTSRSRQPRTTLALVVSALGTFGETTQTASGI